MPEWRQDVHVVDDDVRGDARTLDADPPFSSPDRRHQLPRHYLLHIYSASGIIYAFSQMQCGECAINHFRTSAVLVQPRRPSGRPGEAFVDLSRQYQNREEECRDEHNGSADIKLNVLSCKPLAVSVVLHVQHRKVWLSVCFISNQPPWLSISIQPFPILIKVISQKLRGGLEHCSARAFDHIPAALVVATAGMLRPSAG